MLRGGASKLRSSSTTYPTHATSTSPGVWGRSGIGILLQPIFDGASSLTATALVDIGKVRAIDAGLGGWSPASCRDC